MSTNGADFTHYHGRSIGRSTPAERKRSLAELVVESRAKAAAADAERERISQAKHEEFLIGFRKSIQNDDRYNAEEKAEIIAQSYNW